MNMLNLWNLGAFFFLSQHSFKINESSYLAFSSIEWTLPISPVSARLVLAQPSSLQTGKVGPPARIRTGTDRKNLRHLIDCVHVQCDQKTMSARLNEKSLVFLTVNIFENLHASTYNKYNYIYKIKKSTADRRRPPAAAAWGWRDRHLRVLL